MVKDTTMMVLEGLHKRIARQSAGMTERRGDSG